MRRFKLFYILLLSVVAIPLSSCRDSDNELVVSSKKELLTQKEWVGQVFDATWKLNLNKDGTYSNMFNGIPDETGTWELSKNQQQIILNKGTVNELKTSITMLNSTELHLAPVWELPNEKKLAIEIRFYR